MTEENVISSPGMAQRDPGFPMCGFDKLFKFEEQFFFLSDRKLSANCSL